MRTLKTDHYNQLQPILIMPKNAIERKIPGAGKLTAEELKSISQTTCGELTNMGMICEHAKQGGFPANLISAVAIIIDQRLLIRLNTRTVFHN
jgi:hypothetical protein